MFGNAFGPKGADSPLYDEIVTLKAEVARLDEIAQTKCGENMKLTAERDDMRDLLEEAAGTFGKIGTDEPVSGADTVDWLNDWIPRVRELLEGR